jgi:hypothetical protein
LFNESIVEKTVRAKSPEATSSVTKSGKRGMPGSESLRLLLPSLATVTMMRASCFDCGVL